MDGQADLSLRLAHMPFCWFCHEAAHLSKCHQGSALLLSYLSLSSSLGLRDIHFTLTVLIHSAKSRGNSLISHWNLQDLQLLQMILLLQISACEHQSISTNVHDVIQNS